MHHTVQLFAAFYYFKAIPVHRPPRVDHAQGLSPRRDNQHGADVAGQLRHQAAPHEEGGRSQIGPEDGQALSEEDPSERAVPPAQRLALLRRTGQAGARRLGQEGGRAHSVEPLSPGNKQELVEENVCNEFNYVQSVLLKPGQVFTALFTGVEDTGL